MKNNYIFIIPFAVIFFLCGPSMAQIAVNADGSSPHNSAMLDVSSSVKGVLISRMTATERGSIPSPATGLLVYQTDSPSGFYYYTGSAWVRISETITETDPVFSGWNKSSGILINAAQVSDFNASVTANSSVTANTAKNTYPAADAAKLSGIEAGAEVNVNPDWNATSGDAMILNKPNLAGIPAPVGPNNGDLLTFDGTNWVAKSLVISGGGSSTAVANMQPYLTLNYCIAIYGIYPSRNGMDPFVGEIQIYGFNFSPVGFEFCNGQLMSINSNAALFSLLGTVYGGNGYSTFALPDLRGRTPIHFGQGPGLSNRIIGSLGGSETITLTAPNLPAHSHTVVYQ